MALETKQNSLSYSYQFYATTAEAWDAMHQALLSAERSIFWEVFIFVDDESGKRFVDVLVAKAQAGLEVKMVIDAVGSFTLSRAAIDRLRKAGVDLQFYNRFGWDWHLPRWFSRVVSRNHRKVLIIDESVVFLGGVNIRDDFKTWDDVYLRMIGTSPRPLLRAFAKSYISSGGQRLAVKRLLRPHSRLADLKQSIQYIIHTPQLDRSTSRQVFLRALAAAKDSVNFVTPYYTPDKQFLRAVTLARKRGVKVNIFLPLRTDWKFMELIARAYYRLTLKAGAHVYTLPHMNHGKAITIDDTAGAVGSFNLTKRSFNLDQESGVYFNDKAMVADLNAIFDTYKKIAQPVDVASLKVGWWERCKEWLARMFEPYV